MFLVPTSTRTQERCWCCVILHTSREPSHTGLSVGNGNIFGTRSEDCLVACLLVLTFNYVPESPNGSCFSRLLGNLDGSLANTNFPGGLMIPRNPVVRQAPARIVVCLRAERLLAQPPEWGKATPDNLLLGIISDTLKLP